MVGLEMARAVEDLHNPWHAYMKEIANAQRDDAQHVRLFPLRIDELGECELSRLLSANQFIAAPDINARAPDPPTELRRRDLAQGLAQWLSLEAGRKLRVFISHTKRQGEDEAAVGTLVQAVRKVLDSGRTASFFDAHDLQPGEDWDQALRDGAATSALLALRTDLYARREWCQREMLTAKRHGMPVVALDALTRGEDRGSFLMDHVPRLPLRQDGQGNWPLAPIQRAVNLLVDACLHRVLWLRQQQLAHDDATLARYWWLPQAPEPSTLADWLTTHAGARRAPPPEGLRILHPDPPLAPDECEVLAQIVALAGHASLDLTTPRLLAARGA
jgi:hypothetical protein